METCSVCERPDSAEYTCYRCGEYVCEDCTVVYTQHNLIEETTCHHCRPDEPTMGQYNKPKKPKTMERLTELKSGMQLTTEVLNAWAAAGDNVYYCRWKSHPKVFNQHQYITITIKERPEQYGFMSSVKGVDSMHCFRFQGFVEFYNQFYKLDSPNSTRQWKKEDFYSTKILVPTPEISAQVQKLLFSLGWAWGSDRRANPEYTDAKCIFISESLSLSYTDKEEGLHKYEPNYRIIRWEDILPTASAPKQVRTNFDDCRIICNTVEESKQVQDKLASLGYIWRIGNKYNESSIIAGMHYYVHSDKYLSWDKSHANNYPGYEALKAIDILSTSQQININSITLNQNTDGKQIIVCKPHPTITRGERPAGCKIRGKESRITITGGHYSYRGITG